jgi:hypothetical protein
MYDKFVDGIKIPNFNNSYNSVTSEKFSGKYMFLRFYIENNNLTKFLITLLKDKLDQSKFNTDKDTKIENETSPKLNDLSSINTKSNIDNIWDSNSDEGMLYFLFEVFDNSLSSENNVVIDCNDEKQIDMDVTVKLDANQEFSLPYVKEDIKLDCNIDYNINNYNL